MNPPAVTPALASDTLAALPPAKLTAFTAPWLTYEAEDANTNGELVGPDVTGSTPAREASGRRCVRLAGTGQYVEFKAAALANGIVVRYSLPDSPDGAGRDSSLDLYLNGKLTQKIPITSRYSHLYGSYPFSNDPKAGHPRNFWDEARALTPDIRPGDTVRVQRSTGAIFGADGTPDRAADASAASSADCLIDFIDLEAVSSPLEKPDDFLSVSDFGAVPGDAADDRPAFVAALHAAEKAGSGVWIPPGIFVLSGALDLGKVTLRGAGMWHSLLTAGPGHGPAAYGTSARVALYGKGATVTLADFAITGKLNYRNDSEPNDGIGGSFGGGSVIRNLWIEHTKAGVWVVNSDALLVEDCRFRNTIADGLNLCVGVRNAVVRNCSARGTGDDCFAMWPATYMPSTFPHGGNRFIGCAASLPFLAQAFAIYGGNANAVESCYATDIPYGAGAYASTTFPTEFGFRGVTVFRNLRLLRAGGNEGALGTVANAADLPGLRFQHIQIADCPADAVRFTSIKGGTLRDAVLDQIEIRNPGGAGVIAAPGARGAARLTHVRVFDAKAAAASAAAPDFVLTQGDGNSGITAQR